jgi:hypothetical protein
LPWLVISDRVLQQKLSRVLLVRTQYNKGENSLASFENQLARLEKITLADSIVVGINLHPLHVAQKDSEMNESEHDQVRNKCAERGLSYIPIDVGQLNQFDKLIRCIIRIITEKEIDVAM